MWTSKWAEAGNRISPNLIKRSFSFDLTTIPRFRRLRSPLCCLLQGTREPGLYILDCLFSVLVIGSLVVFVWRGLYRDRLETSTVNYRIFFISITGLWVLLDLKLYPEDPKASAWASSVSYCDTCDDLFNQMMTVWSPPTVVENS